MTAAAANCATLTGRDTGHMDLLAATPAVPSHHDVVDEGVLARAV